jgi:hypothetical protein
VRQRREGLPASQHVPKLEDMGNPLSPDFAQTIRTNLELLHIRPVCMDCASRNTTKTHSIHEYPIQGSQPEPWSAVDAILCANLLSRWIPNRLSSQPLFLYSPAVHQLWDTAHNYFFSEREEGSFWDVKPYGLDSTVLCRDEEKHLIQSSSAGEATWIAFIHGKQTSEQTQAVSN